MSSVRDGRMPLNGLNGRGALNPNFRPQTPTIPMFGGYDRKGPIRYGFFRVCGEHFDLRYWKRDAGRFVAVNQTPPGKET